MNNGVSFVIGAVIGAGIGGVVTWKVLEEKYKRLADCEIESVREMYKTKYGKESEPEEETDVEEKETVAEEVKTEEKPDIVTYRQYAKQYTSTNTARPGEEKEEEVDIYDEVKPYRLINEDEYGMFSDYETVEYDYYEGDQILVDDEDTIVDDYEFTVGEDFAEQIGKVAPGVAYIRNDENKTDYMILQVNASYYG